MNNPVKTNKLLSSAKKIRHMSATISARTNAKPFSIVFLLVLLFYLQYTLKIKLAKSALKIYS